MILQLAWRNIWRAKRRSILGLLAITAVAFMLGVLPAMTEGQFRSYQEQTTQTWSGYAQLQHPDFNEHKEQHLTIKVDERTRQALNALPSGVHWSPRVTSAGVASSQSRSLAIVLSAEDPQRAPDIARVYRRDLVEGRFLSGGDLSGEGEAVIGAKLAELLQVGIGNTITLMVTDLEGSMVFDRVTIIGLVKTNWQAFNRQYVAVNLYRYEQLMALDGRRHAIIISGELDATAAATQELKATVGGDQMAVRDWIEIFPTIAKQAMNDRNVIWMVFIVLFLIVGLAEANSVMMSTLERRREFGMVMALGVNHRLIAASVWLEYLLLAMAGTAIGMSLAAVLVAHFNEVGIVIGDPDSGQGLLLRPQFTLWRSSLPPLAFVLLIGLITLIPVSRMGRLNILQAMRSA